MSRWDKSNNVEYKGANIARRDLLETINYDNAFNILQYIKYLYEKGVDTQIIYRFVAADFGRFVIFLYEEMNDKLFVEVTREDLDRFIFYEKKRSDISLSYFCKIIYIIRRFYDFLIAEGKATSNPANNVIQLLNYQRTKQDKHKKISTNYITDEQIGKAKNELPDHLKLYMMFSVSTGAKSEEVRNLKWNQVDLNERTAKIGDSILYFSEEVSDLLKKECQYREDKNMYDCGYVFRSHVKSNFSKDKPIGIQTLSIWCKQIGEIIDIPNLRHLDLRHSTIKKLLSATGSVGMTSILTNYPYLNMKAKKFFEESNNNELLSKYKDICEI